MDQSRIRRRQPLTDLSEYENFFHPVLKRVFENRAIESPEQLDLSIQKLPSPSSIDGIDKASQQLVERLSRGQSIVIIGDYDADGASSTALMLLSLKRLARVVGSDPDCIRYVVPDRFGYGYGLGQALIDSFEVLPDGLITVDNGITSQKAVEYAYSRGLWVIITDHHLPDENIPEADAVINPQKPTDDSGLTNLAGVGVAFYLALGLRSYLRDQGYDDQQFVIADLLDLVAIGTIADVMILDQTNRILIEHGLRIIRAGRTRTGVEELLDACGVAAKYVTSKDIAFRVAPRINAAGRMSQIDIAIEALLTQDTSYAQRQTLELNRLNEKRKRTEKQMVNEALSDIDTDIQASGQGVCVFSENWHQGVTGLLANRLKEQYQRPVIAFAPAGDEYLAGSARSIDGVHMRTLIEQIEQRDPQSIVKYGGHAMAAGLTIEKDKFERFRSNLAQILEEGFEYGLPVSYIETDGGLSVRDRTISMAERIDNVGPWGRGFEYPCFDDLFWVCGAHIVGSDHVRLDLMDPEDDTSFYSAFCGFGVRYGYEQLEGLCRIVYELEINRFRGQRELQLNVNLIEKQG